MRLVAGLLVNGEAAIPLYSTIQTEAVVVAFPIVLYVASYALLRGHLNSLPAGFLSPIAEKSPNTPAT